MKYLTWAMLKERIEQMSEDEQQQPVMAWGDETPLTKVDIFVMSL